MATEGSRFFFSYAREDSEIVLRLARELRKAGAKVWLDQLDIRGGSRWDEAVQAALESCQGLVAVLSPSSVASQNFLDEVSYALEEQKQVIPLLYRECAIPFRLRRVQYVNFTADYEKGFADLLRALGLEMPEEIVAPPVIEARAPDGVMRPAIQEGEKRDEPVVEMPSREAREEFSTEQPAPVIGIRRGALRNLQNRGMAAVVGAVGGLVIGGLLFLFSEGTRHENWWGDTLSACVLWAIAGVITGNNRKMIITSLATSVGLAVVTFSTFSSDNFLRNFRFETARDWASFGALIGATGALLAGGIGVIFKKLKARRSQSGS